MRRRSGPLPRLQSQLLLALCLPLLAACGGSLKPPRYRAPEIPPECRDQVFQDPTVRHLIAAGTAVPIYAAQHQDELAYAQAEAVRKCEREKGLIQGGVEPKRYRGYPSPF